MESPLKSRAEPSRVALLGFGTVGQSVAVCALSGLGGTVGIMSGYLLANIVRFGIKRLVDLPPVHTPLWAIVLAFGFCAFLGVLFGIYPAAKASKLDPIEALRYE